MNCVVMMQLRFDIKTNEFENNANNLSVEEYKTTFAFIAQSSQFVHIVNAA